MTSSSLQDKAAGLWTALLAAKGWEKQQERGLLLARHGKLLNMEIRKSLISARIQDQPSKTIHLEIRVKPFPAEIWDAVTAAIAAQARLSADLLTDDLTPALAKLFPFAGYSLFPQTLAEIAVACSCNTPTAPCEHAAAVFHTLNRETAIQPFTIFLLRGRSREILLADLVRHRSHLQAPLQPAATMLPAEHGSLNEQAAMIESFWQAATEAPDALPGLPPDNCLEQLGNPPGWHARHDLNTVMQVVYQWVRHTNKCLK